MSDYQHSVEIQASRDAVFEFVSNPENMPRFLPTLEEAHSAGSDRVEMRGNAVGHPYAIEGHIHLDPDERSMHWGSEKHGGYHGQLQVTGDDLTSCVSVRLSFAPGEMVEQQIKSREGSDANIIQRKLEESLEKVKSICESDSVAVEARNRGYLG